MKLFLKYTSQILFQIVSLIVLFIILRSILHSITDYSLLVSLILSISITQLFFGFSFVKSEIQNKGSIVLIFTIFILIINLLLFQSDFEIMITMNSLDDFIYTNFTNFDLSLILYSNVLLGLVIWNTIFFFIKFKTNNNK
jgi:hypothetical protein